MSKRSTTIRLEPTLQKGVLREAKKAGLTFSGVVHFLLQAFVDGDVHIGVTQLPKAYLRKISKEADALRLANRKGETKRFASSKELFDDILKR